MQGELMHTGISQVPIIENNCFLALSRCYHVIICGRIKMLVPRPSRTPAFYRRTRVPGEPCSVINLEEQGPPQGH